MKKVLLISALALSSCAHKSMTTEAKPNGVDVELLFTHDSVTVYRFYDAGRYHYFTSRGETITTQHTGKTTIQENIK